jgi:hypothetical protein
MAVSWTKPEVVTHAIYPQLPSFCAVAACAGAANALLGTDHDQRWFHEVYAAGAHTRLRLPPGPLPGDLDAWPRSGPGIGNWDLIRLFNSVMLDAGKEPHSALLCGADFVREAAGDAVLERLLEWARLPSSQVVVHLARHYVLLAGLVHRHAGADVHLVVADSAPGKGPIRSLPLAEVRELAERDPRYGWILLADRPLPERLFSRWSDEMLPPEVRQRERFERKDRTR